MALAIGLYARILVCIRVVVEGIGVGDSRRERGDEIFLRGQPRPERKNFGLSVAFGALGGVALSLDAHEALGRGHKRLLLVGERFGDVGRVVGFEPIFGNTGGYKLLAPGGATRHAPTRTVH